MAECKCTFFATIFFATFFSLICFTFLSFLCLVVVISLQSSAIVYSRWSDNCLQSKSRTKIAPHNRVSKTRKPINSTFLCLLEKSPFPLRQLGTSATLRSSLLFCVHVLGFVLVFGCLSSRDTGSFPSSGLSYSSLSSPFPSNLILKSKPQGPNPWRSSQFPACAIYWFLVPFICYNKI